ncbi:MAG: FHA domain-containing protein [Anaerolineae bacterium]|nr:FHA domain-containing protein [Anaerolineae bacterium]
MGAKGRNDGKIVMKKYKYECRPCPSHIRAQCIREATLSPAIKRIITRAFDSRTDTEDTWDVLQRNCLLVRLEQVPTVSPTGTGPRKGGIWDRLHGKEEPAPVREPVQEPEIPTVRPRTGQPGSSPIDVERQVPPKVQPQTVVPIETLTSSMPPAQPAEPAWPPARERPVSSPPRPPVTGQARSQYLTYPEAMPSRSAGEDVPGPRVLVSLANGHRILLPDGGELVLGRFDSLTGIRPDVDLSFEDRSTMAVSRRHARIIGWHNRYEIEDLGSSNGTWINNKRLNNEQKQPLKVGDVVRLGRCIFFVTVGPELWQHPMPDGRYFLYATFSGNFFPLARQGEMLIGRADLDLGFRPDVDLGEEPGVETVVSRRHAKMIAQRGQFAVQDLGSTCGTRLDGREIPVGAQVPVKPGQHLWLGGYTLAFDVI